MELDKITTFTNVKNIYILAFKVLKVPKSNSNSMDYIVPLEHKNFYISIVFWSHRWNEVSECGSFMFLGVHINNKLEWSKHIKTVRKLQRFGMGPEILKRFHSCNIESILTGCITAWYGNCLASDRKALQSRGRPINRNGRLIRANFKFS
jgi:hypothetical protein